MSDSSSKKGVPVLEESKIEDGRRKSAISSFMGILSKGQDVKNGSCEKDGK